MTNESRSLVARLFARKGEAIPAAAGAIGSRPALPGGRSAGSTGPSPLSFLIQRRTDAPVLSPAPARMLRHAAAAWHAPAETAKHQPAPQPRRALTLRLSAADYETVTGIARTQGTTYQRFLETAVLSYVEEPPEHTEAPLPFYSSLIRHRQ